MLFDPLDQNMGDSGIFERSILAAENLILCLFPVCMQLSNMSHYTKMVSQHGHTVKK